MGTAKQSILLTAAQGSTLLLSFLLTIFIARGLSVADYGQFRYAMTFLGLAVSVFHFGWPISASRVLALESDRHAHRETVGACFILVAISSGVGTTVSLLLFLGAKVLGFQLPDVVIWILPFVYVTVGQYMISSICQGLNRIALLSSQQVLVYLLLIPITVIQVQAIGSYSLGAAIAGYVVVFTVVLSVGFVRLGCAFTNSISRVRMILKENRRTGFPIYIGGIFGVASAQIVIMWTVQFLDPTSYGQFALAVAVSAPLGVMVSSIGTVIYRSSAGVKSLPGRVIGYSLGLAVLLGAAFYAATKVLLISVFGAQYAPAIAMSQLLGLGFLMTGIGDIFQRFLGSKGKGKGLGSSAVLAGLLGVVVAGILLPRWHAYGAIASSLATATVYLVSMVTLYILHILKDGTDGAGPANGVSVTQNGGALRL